MTEKEFNQVLLGQIELELKEIPESEYFDFLIYLRAYSKIKDLVKKIEL